MLTGLRATAAMNGRIAWPIVGASRAHARAGRGRLWSGRSAALSASSSSSPPLAAASAASAAVASASRAPLNPACRNTQLMPHHPQHQHQRHLRSMVVAASAGDSSGSGGSSSGNSNSSGGGLPFALSRPARSLRFPWGRRMSRVREEDMQIEVDAMVEGRPALPGKPAPSDADLTALLRRVQADCARAVPLALAAKKERNPKWPLPALASVSLVLCDDDYIRALNAAHRGKDSATDVLSFEVPDEPGEVPPPVKLLGDLVVSLDTAARQAEERGYTLEDELRVLLVHGALHLVGFDHEQGGPQLDDMAAAEASIMERLEWRGQGLIEAVTGGSADGSDSESDDDGGSGKRSNSSSNMSSSMSSSSRTSGGSGSASAASTSASDDRPTAAPGGGAGGGRGAKFRSSAPRLVAIDMDGTLLDSQSRVLPSSAEAIRAALARGVRVVIATGKARPAAIAACEAAGLAGDALLVSRRTPGVFLQGLAVHGAEGRQLSDAALPPAVVARAFAWARDASVSCAAFLGDHCATLAMTPELRELHDRYYEPLASVAPSLDELLAGPPVKKLLFMADEARILGEVAPFWSGELRDGRASGAETMQAVPNMLEVVPSGVNKWQGLQVLMGHLRVSPGDLMAIGDGGNDAEMVRHAGLGVAMANAVPETLKVASAVVASNDDGGVAEAIERFVL